MHCKYRPKPVTFAQRSMTANGVVLIGDPDDENDVERRRRVVEEFRHDRLHA